jgi:hypothetical protein
MTGQLQPAAFLPHRQSSAPLSSFSSTSNRSRSQSGASATWGLPTVAALNATLGSSSFQSSMSGGASNNTAAMAQGPSITSRRGSVQKLESIQQSLNAATQPLLAFTELDHTGMPNEMAARLAERARLRGDLHYAMGNGATIAADANAELNAQYTMQPQYQMPAPPPMTQQELNRMIRENSASASSVDPRQPTIRISSLPAAVAIDPRISGVQQHQPPPAQMPHQYLLQQQQQRQQVDAVQRVRDLEQSYLLDDDAPVPVGVHIDDDDTIDNTDESLRKRAAAGSKRRWSTLDMSNVRMRALRPPPPHAWSTRAIATTTSMPASTSASTSTPTSASSTTSGDTTAALKPSVFCWTWCAFVVRLDLQVRVMLMALRVPDRNCSTTRSMRCQTRSCCRTSRISICRATDFGTCLIVLLGSFWRCQLDPNCS